MKYYMNTYEFTRWMWTLKKLKKMRSEVQIKNVEEDKKQPNNG